MSKYGFRFFIRILASLWILLAILCVSPFQKVFASTVPASTAPSISVNIGGSASNSVSSGAKVTVVGRQFGPNETIAATLNGTLLTLTPNPTVSDSNGSFSATFRVPAITTPRVYVLSATGQTSSISATTMLWMKAKNESIYSPIASSDSFTITDNNAREPQGQYVRITNTGDATIIGPRLFPDSLPGSQDPYLDTSSLQNLVNGILAANPQAITPAQEALAIWTWMTHYSYHYYDPEKPDPKIHEDFIDLLDVYGYTRCWQAARLMTDLLTIAGL